MHSLYGKTEAELYPRAEWLADLDAVVIDLQDVGPIDRDGIVGRGRVVGQPVEDGPQRQEALSQRIWPWGFGSMSSDATKIDAVSMTVPAEVIHELLVRAEERERRLGGGSPISTNQFSHSPTVAKRTRPRMRCTRMRNSSAPAAAGPHLELDHQAPARERRRSLG